ncbi:MAG: hypothetical protein H6923_03135 [Alphaproteobacteria bacterium]|nr:hypothetical protein [Alphaproteobacteria bacterium]
MSRSRSFASLARIHRMTVDELRRGLVELEAAREGCLATAETIADEMEAEAARLAPHHGALGDFAPYFASARGRRQNALREADEIAALIAEVRERLSDAFRRTKTFELLESERVLAEEHEAKRRDAVALDEAAGIAHHRRSRPGK